MTGDEEFMDGAKYDGQEESVELYDDEGLYEEEDQGQDSAAFAEDSNEVTDDLYDAYAPIVDNGEAEVVADGLSEEGVDESIALRDDPDIDGRFAGDEPTGRHVYRRPNPCHPVEETMGEEDAWGFRRPILCSDSEGEEEVLPPVCRTRCDSIDLCDVDPEYGMVMDFLTVGDFRADDGELCHEEDGSIVIDSKPFTTWTEPNPNSYLDHFKYVLLSQKDYEVPLGGSLEVEFKAKAKVCGLENAPFPPQIVVDNDYRLGNGDLCVVDFENGLIFGFLLTNDRIYARYQRFAFPESATAPNTALFTYVVPVGERTEDKVSRMKVLLDGDQRQVTYFVDGVDVFHISRPAVRLNDKRLEVSDFGGLNDDVQFPSAVKIIIGTSTLLDYYPAPKNVECSRPDVPNGQCGLPELAIGLVRTGEVGLLPEALNPESGLLANYYDPEGTCGDKHIWGQGVQLRIDSIKIAKKVCEAQCDHEEERD